MHTDKLLDVWKEYVRWATDTENSLLGFYFTVVVVALITSVILSFIFLITRPKLALERVLGFREGIFVLILGQSLFFFLTGTSPSLLVRIGVYIAWVIVNILILVFLIRERIMDDREYERYLEENYDKY